MKTRKFWLTVLTSLVILITYLGWTPDALAFTEEQKLVLQSWRLVNQSYLDDTFNHQNW
ncbi:MAG: carboxyl-terminal protease, partial [Microcystaceae cyanobacterium]